MAEACLIDNDVLLKVCAYDLVDEFLELFASQSLLILPTAPYVVGSVIKRTGRIKDKTRAAANLQRLVAAAAVVEPRADEIQSAAELEERAHQGSFELDGGESILFVLLSNDRAQILLTGDKRAIAALEQVSPSLSKPASVTGRIAGLEQLISALILKKSPEEIAVKVCSEPDVDKAIAICFRCSSGNFEPNSAMEGLASYIEDLRRAAPKLLIPDEGLVELLAHEHGIG